MNKIEKSTEQLTNELKDIKSEGDLEKWIKDNKIGKLKFGDELYEILESKNLDTSDIVKDADLSKSYIYDLRNNKKKPTKSTVLRIGFAIKLNSEEINRLLKAAGLKELYSKKEDDAIIMYGLDKKIDKDDIDKMLRNHGYGNVFYDDM